MDHSSWLQLIFFLLILTALTKPMGAYLFNVLNPQGKTGLEFALKPLEKLTYRLCGIDTQAEQDWKKYTASLFVFSLFGILFTFVILSLQSSLPLNPQALPSMDTIGVFNASVSYVTNTDWESYIPEQTLSYFSTMFALTAQNFCSAAVGICVAAALARGIANNASKALTDDCWTNLGFLN